MGRVPAAAATLLGLAITLLPAGQAQALAPAAGGPGIGVVSTDFNGDGYADTAIGVPFEDVNGHNAAGGVNVLYGGPGGLGQAGNQFWTQDSPGVLDQAENGDEFGRRLAAGDFDGDGYDDLAVGVPIESVGSVNGAGAVNVLYGSPAGLSSDRNQFWTQDSPGVPDQIEVNDRFGDRVKSGDFNGDGFDDLVAEAQREDVGQQLDAGAFIVLYGSAAGLTASGSRFWTQDSPGVLDRAGAGDLFAEYASSGDFDGDGYDDLALGAPGDSVGSVNVAGVVNVLYGSPAGLAADRNQVWSQNSPGVLDRAEAIDSFGRSVAAGDYNGDGFADLSIGVQLEDVGTAIDAGAVNVLYGSPEGLTATGNQFWTQDSPGIGDRSEEGDQWGRYQAWADFDADGYPDLIVGAPFEDVGSVVDAGGANVLYGSAAGLTATGSQYWTQDSPGIEEEADPADELGRYFPSSS